MKLTPNKFIILTSLMLGFSSFAKQGPPPPPAGPPTPPGFPIDTNVYLLVFLGVIFSFIYFRNYIKSGKKI